MKKFINLAGKKAKELSDKLLNSEISQEIGAKEKIQKVKTASQNAYTKTKSALSTGKQKTYEAIGNIEAGYENEKGLGGEVKRTIRKGQTILKALQFASKPLIGNRVDKLTDKTKEYYELLTSYNETFIDTFTTEGKYDEEKFNHLLLNKVAMTEVYGKKAIDTLISYIKFSAQAINKDYREIIPTPEEIKTKYAGIGITLEGILLKPDLDKCLNFHGSVYAKLPKNPLTLEIMKDIKDNVITNREDLLKLYVSDKNTHPNMDKMRLVLSYSTA